MSDYNGDAISSSEWLAAEDEEHGGMEESNNIENLLETPKILDVALRQYQHNNCSGFVVGFDYDETVKIVTRLQKGLRAVRDLINSSQGVYGLHLNGDPSPWEELEEGGEFEEWLIDFNIAEEE